MKPFSPDLALSAVETESLRAMRSRIGRPPPGDAALGVLGRAVFEVLARVNLTPAGEAEALPPEAIVARAAGADVAALRALLASLQVVLEGPAAGWRKAVQAGAPQAVISRRLALAGREAPKDAA
jgi:hypothetical protein